MIERHYIFHSLSTDLIAFICWTKSITLVPSSMELGTKVILFVPFFTVRFFRGRTLQVTLIKNTYTYGTMQ